MNQTVERQIVSLYPSDWAVVAWVERQYNAQRSQALRFIINDYRLRHNIPVPPTPKEEPPDDPTDTPR